MTDHAASPWRDALRAAALLAVDPQGTGGAAVRSLPGPVRDRWLARLRALLPAATPFRRLPLHITDGRLLGGLDLAATLKAGRPVAERGLLAESDGGVIVAAMAERLAPGTAARLAAALDAGEVALERDGLAARLPARIGVVALDEGVDADERPPAALLDRLAFQLDLSSIALREADAERAEEDAWSRADIVGARRRLARVRASDAVLEALAGTAVALGVESLRAVLLALRAARAAAALAGADEVGEREASTAARLVLAPRATRLPASEPAPEAPAEADSPEAPPEDPAPPERKEDAGEVPSDGPLEDVVLEAARAAIPAGLLAQLQLAATRTRVRTTGRAGAVSQSSRRGRPAGTRRGELTAGARLNVIETLRAAAPWQPLRRREGSRRAAAPRVEVRRDDFRIARFRHRTETTTIFAVDASGSAALHRLAEAKGAVELLLADCYVRRDRVALIAFRGTAAELVLPPTRSLVRAKRSLAGLPGGGGTPLASGLDAAGALADAVKRRGGTPVVVVLTDGRANIARDGAPGRSRAEEEAVAAARALRGAGVTAVLVDVGRVRIRSPNASPRRCAPRTCRCRTPTHGP